MEWPEWSNLTCECQWCQVRREPLRPAVAVCVMRPAAVPVQIIRPAASGPSSVVQPIYATGGRSWWPTPSAPLPTILQPSFPMLLAKSVIQTMVMGLGVWRQGLTLTSSHVSRLRALWVQQFSLCAAIARVVGLCTPTVTKASYAVPPSAIAVGSPIGVPGRPSMTWCRYNHAHVT